MLLNESESEKWRPVPNFEDYYEISTEGRIKRIDSGKILIPITIGKGYKSVTLCCPGFQKREYVHRLVLLTFIGPPPGGKNDGAHWDGDRANNKLNNLRWASRKENVDDMKRHGTTQSGEKNAQAKLTEQDVVRLLEDYLSSSKTIIQIEKENRLTHGMFEAIVGRRSWIEVTKPFWERLDKVKRLKKALGGKHPISKLTADKVRLAAQLVKDGESMSSVARKFQVSLSAIQNIMKGRTWWYVTNINNQELKP